MDEGADSVSRTQGHSSALDGGPCLLGPLCTEQSWWSPGVTNSSCLFHKPQGPPLDQSPARTQTGPWGPGDTAAGLACLQPEHPPTPVPPARCHVHASTEIHTSSLSHYVGPRSLQPPCGLLVLTRACVLVSSSTRHWRQHPGIILTPPVERVHWALGAQLLVPHG